MSATRAGTVHTPWPGLIAAYRDRLQVERHPTGLDARDVEQVVQDLRDAYRLLVDDAQELLPLRGIPIQRQH